MILAARADPRAVDSVGFTALHLAAQFGRVELVQELLRAEARVDARTTKGRGAAGAGWTPLRCAASTGHAAVCEALLAAGASPLAACQHGATVLHHATTCFNAGAAVRLLVGARADLEARAAFPFCCTPLYAAAFFNNAQVVEALIELRADVDARVRSIVGFFRSTTARDAAVMFRRQAALAVLDR